MWELKKTIVMVGMMGSGKTAIGRSLAASLGVVFLDSDQEIEAAANASIAEIFQQSGETFFREREAAVLERLLLGPPCILSTGGGAFLAERNRDLIATHGVSLWLNADLDLLWERVRQKDHRPLLRTENPRKTLARIFADRVPIYQKAQLSVAVDPGSSIEQTTQKVIGILRHHIEILEKNL